jgi:hypothetical protein
MKTANFGGIKGVIGAHHDLIGFDKLWQHKSLMKK